MKENLINKQTTFLKPVGEVIMMLLLLGGLVLSLQFLTPGVLPQAGAESETSVASAYPLPPYPLSTPALTNTPAEIPPTFSFFEGATITPPPHTPFPTSTLDPGPTPTDIPLVLPAKSAEGKIFYFTYEDKSKQILHSVDVNSKGRPNKEPVKNYEGNLVDFRVYPSPDGKRLAFIGPWGEGAVLHVASNQFDWLPATWGRIDFYNWFPDNRQILYKDELGHLSLGNVITGKTITLYAVRYGVVRGASVSPDGRKVVFSYDEGMSWKGIWIVDANGQNAHKLLDGGGTNFAWSPDGKQIAFDGMVMNADGTDLRPLVTAWPQELVQPQCYFYPPQWSPDSQYLAIVMVPGDKLSVFCGSKYNPQLFEDVTLVIVHVADQNVYLIPTDNILGNLDPAWSPDGNQLAFISGRSGAPEIWIVNTDGTDLRQLTSNAKKVRFLFWQRP